MIASSSLEPTRWNVTFSRISFLNSLLPLANPSTMLNPLSPIAKMCLRILEMLWRVFWASDTTTRIVGIWVCPLRLGGKKRDILGFIKNKIMGRIHGWNNRFLSRVGREVYLKNFIQAIPMYARSVFLLPMELCKEIEVTLNAFWWKGSKMDEKGLHWKSWHNLCIPKKYGGLGF